jgi:hypothetical protein
MKVCSKFHAPATLIAGKEPPVPFGQEAVWDLVLV